MEDKLEHCIWLAEQFTALLPFYLESWLDRTHRNYFHFDDCLSATDLVYLAAIQAHQLGLSHAVSCKQLLAMIAQAFAWLMPQLATECRN